MSLQQQYRELFDKEIIQKSKGIFFRFVPSKNAISSIHMLMRFLDLV